MVIRKAKDIIPRLAESCHDGEGTLLCRNLLAGFDSVNFRFMHCDDLPAGVSIGNHLHDKNEEVYFLVSGKGILTYDDEEYEEDTHCDELCLFLLFLIYILILRLYLLNEVQRNC